MVMSDRDWHERDERMLRADPFFPTSHYPVPYESLPKRAPRPIPADAHKLLPDEVVEQYQRGCTSSHGSRDDAPSAQ